MRLLLSSGALVAMVALWLGLVPAPVSGFRGDGPLSRDDLRVLLQSLRAQYRTILCTFQVETPLATEARKGKYYQAADGTLRADCRRSDAFDHDLVIKGGIRYLHNRFTKTLQISSNLDAQGKPMDLGLSEIWSMMGFRVVNRHHDLVWVDELLADAAEDCSIATTSAGDIQLTHRGKYGTFVRTFARRYNFLPTAWEFHEGAARAQAPDRAEVAKVREIKPGLYFPEEIRAASHTKNQGQETHVTRVTRFADVRVNDPIPSGTFDLPKCPPGTMVVDAINQVIDQIDANGNRVRTQRTFVDGAKLGNLAQGARQTESEPSNTAWYVGLGVTSILLAMGGIWLLRRQHAANLR